MTFTFQQAFTSQGAVTESLASVGYIASNSVAMAVYLAQQLRKPVLIEGPAGVGKTDLAVSLSKTLSCPLIRLQCYQGLDDAKALYEWKYGKQLLYTQMLKEKIGHIVNQTDDLATAMTKLNSFQDVFFSRDFLQARPLLTAMEQDGPSVLLIDEIDKAEEEFEAMLLEVLSDYQVSIPEIGTVHAKFPPLVLLTSNNTRELGDALKRRCLHLHIGFPDAALEAAVVRSRVPEIGENLLAKMIAFVQSLRTENLRKLPSISESIDWARTLVLLHADTLSEALVLDTLNVLLKRQSDIAEAAPAVKGLVDQANQAINRSARQ